MRYSRQTGKTEQGLALHFSQCKDDGTGVLCTKVFLPPANRAAALPCTLGVSVMPRQGGRRSNAGNGAQRLSGFPVYRLYGLRIALALLLLISFGVSAYARVTTVENPNDILVLVNRNYALPSGFRPSDLVNVGNGQQMRQVAANAFFDMHRSMNHAGLFLTVRSGFRSYETQRTLFNNAVANQGLAAAERWIARPGHSEHQTGLAVDILQRGFTGSPLSSARFQNTPQFAWLQRYAHTYGFIMRYPGEYEHITGFAFEPWHWRYIGAESATYMRVNGFAVFEQYIEHRRTIPDPLPDVPSDWAAPLIEEAIALGLVPEQLQSHYTQAATRAEFAALAVTLYERIQGEIIGRTTFSDTNDVYVQKAAYIGLVEGVGDNRFAPDVLLTREQAAVMLSRLAVALGQTPPRQTADFTDAASISDWASEHVAHMQTTGIMHGIGDGSFAPHGSFTREQSMITILRLYQMMAISNWAVQSVAEAVTLGLVPEWLQSHYTQAATRAEFAALAVTLYERIQGEITGRATFSDTSDVYVQKAAYIGLVEGVGDNRFAPDVLLTREQAAVMLSRLAVALDQTPPRQTADFTNAASISDWASEHVAHMQATGIMHGMDDGSFAPHGSFTREQSMITILRLYQMMAEEREA